MSARLSVTKLLPVLALSAGLLTIADARGESPVFLGRESAIHLTTAQIVSTEVRAGRLTVLSEGRRLVVVTDSMSPAVSALRPGDHVVLGYRVVQGPQGAPRYVLAALQRSSGVVRTRTVTTTPARVTTTTRVESTTAVPSTRLVWPTVAQTAPLVTSWTPTVAPAPSSNAGIPLAYVVANVPSVPLPTPAPGVALPPGTAAAVTETDLDRFRAEQDFQAAAAQLAVSADSIDRMWQGHRQLCMPADVSNTSRQRDWFRLLDGNMAAPDTDACRQERQQLERLAQRFRDQLQNSVQTARASDVLPGRIREILDRQRIDL